MLYVYSFYEQFEGVKNEEDLLKAIESCGKLIPFGDGGHWLSKSESIILNGEELEADGKLCNYISDWFNDSDYMEIYTLLAGKIELAKENAVGLLTDDLSLGEEGQYKYEDRIWNAEEPDEEISAILKELGLVVLDMFIQEVNQAYESIKNNGFEWK